MINQSNPLIFTHIPKTGGMSMFAGMCEHHGMQVADMYNMSALDTDWNPVAEILSHSEKSVYAGHFPFGLHQWLTRPSYYIAFVRKPMDRIISLYYYSIRIRRIIRAYHEETGETYEQQFAHRNAPDFYLDFLPWIKGEQTFVNFLRCRSAELDNAMVRRFSGIGLQPGPCPKEALKLAKSNIENYFSVVGLQEHYKESVQLIRSAFQLELTDYHVNKGVDRQTSEIKLSIEDRMRIKQMNKMDTDLYKWIKSRFDKQLVDTPSPILVPGGGRTDFDQATLWHAIGNSPIRQKAMEQNPAVFKK